MSAYVKVIEEKDYLTLKTYLERDGVVLVSPEMARKLEEETGKEIDGLFLDRYDFGGEADKFVDLIQSEQHFAVEAIRRLRRKETWE